MLAEQLAELWALGKKEAVLMIAEKRLAQDPEDIAGLLVKLEYSHGMCLLNDWLETAQLILVAGRKIESPRFSAAFAEQRPHLERMLHAWSYAYEYETNRSRELHCAELIRFAEEDGIIG